MTYLEMEQQVSLLKEILREALKDGAGWRQLAEEALAPPKPSDFGRSTARWDGEECGCCHHSSTFHAGSTGLCTKVDCECMKFVPTGRANTQAR